jgi:ATP-dependent Clp protease adaptor protein ClpS
MVVPTQTQIRPEEDSATGLGQPWMVILYNDDYHTFEEVIAQVQKATGCSPEEAFQITYAAHTNGQAVAYVGDRPLCNEVVRVLREIDLRVELEQA